MEISVYFNVCAGILIENFLFFFLFLNRNNIYIYTCVLVLCENFFIIFIFLSLIYGFSSKFKISTSLYGKQYYYKTREHASNDRVMHKDLIRPLDLIFFCKFQWQNPTFSIFNFIISVLITYFFYNYFLFFYLFFFNNTYWNNFNLFFNKSTFFFRNQFKR